MAVCRRCCGRHDSLLLLLLLRLVFVVTCSQVDDRSRPHRRHCAVSSLHGIVVRCHAVTGMQRGCCFVCVQEQSR